jgi:outer membrane protein assembly factor BamB
MIRPTPLLLCLLLSSPVAAPAQSVEPWSTYRGDPQRTGNTDNQAGPAVPKVLWSLKSNDNHIAAPLPVGDRLIVSGLGGFNIAHLHCLSVAPAAKKRVLWSKTAPFLKLATVSSPGLFKGRLVFGDGMHQTDGATLYCLDVAEGVPLWRYPVPGQLVHLEGSPAISDGKAYIGGGAAGVLCVAVEKAELEGKALDLDELHKVMSERWQTLVKKFAVERVKDEFAVPPNEDQLPRAHPKQLWRQGEEKWHVDAPVAVVGAKVLASSAFLDKEKVGDRALFCLDAKSGNVLWRAPLKYNPWGGPSVQGDTVIVSGGSIGYDTRALKGAKGFIAAFDLADGKPKWTKEVPGGIVACAALAGGSAVVTATDGKVRAFDVATGERQWIYEAKTPLFAPVAIAKDVVYAGDLAGAIHAIDLKDGQGKWTLELGKAPEVQAPGMIYGGPVVQAGRLYVATCNLEGAHAGQPTAIVCIGEK